MGKKSLFSRPFRFLPSAPVLSLFTLPCFVVPSPFSPLVSLLLFLFPFTLFCPFWSTSLPFLPFSFLPYPLPFKPSFPLLPFLTLSSLPCFPLPSHPISLTLPSCSFQPFLLYIFLPVSSPFVFSLSLSTSSIFLPRSSLTLPPLSPPISTYYSFLPSSPFLFHSLFSLFWVIRNR